MPTVHFPNWRKIIPYFLSIWILLNGCARLSFPEYEAGHFNSYEQSEVKDELAVAISPIINKDEVRKYFGAGFRSANMLPVFVALKNRNSSKSFMLLTNKIYLQVGKSANAASSNGKNMSNDAVGKSLGVASFVLLPLPVMSLSVNVLAAERFAEADAIRANAANKELTSKTISPGQYHNGFVYFQLPRKSDTPEQLRLRIELLDQKAREPLTFDLPVQLTMEE